MFQFAAKLKQWSKDPKISNLRTWSADELCQVWIMASAEFLVADENCKHRIPRSTMTQFWYIAACLPFGVQC